MMSLSRLAKTAFIAFPAFTAAFSIGWLVSIPGGSAGGFSVSRLAIIALLALLGAAFAGGGFLFWRYAEAVEAWLSQKAARFDWLLFLFGTVIFFLSFYILNLPEKSLGGWQAIHLRLSPLFAWACLTSFQLASGLVVWRASQRGGNAGLQTQVRPILRASSLWLVLLFFIGLFIAFTRLGLAPVEDFWSKPAVPLLWPQVGAVFVIALWLARFLPAQKWADVLLLILLAAAAIFLWGNQTFVPGAFNTVARPPSDEIFPINDSQIFDAASQGLLLGQRMPSDVIDKPLYISLLAALHLLAGVSYQRFYWLQIVFFASIPLCAYFLGKQLHSRGLGMVLAGLFIVKELNAIALTNYLSVSTTRMILSEPLTTLGVLLFMLAFTQWLKQPAQPSPALWAAGAVLGLTGLVRLNSVTILPAAMVVIGLAVRFRWKPWLTFSAVLVFFALVSFTPWFIRNTVVSGDPINFIRSKTEGVIANQRYVPALQQPAPSAQNSPPALSALTKISLLAPKIANHYLHNLVSITFVLPPTPQANGLLEMVRLPFWKLGWDGRMDWAQALSLVFILSIFAIGLGAAWERQKAAGLAPLAAALGYNLSAAVALTSGGRYIVPFDWLLPFYFSWGMVEIFGWISLLFNRPQVEIKSADAPSAASRFRGRVLAVWISAALLLGALPVVFEFVPPARYPASPSLNSFWQANRAVTALQRPEMQQKIEQLAQDPAFVLAQGRLLYPRYYLAGQGDQPDLFSALLGKQGYDRFTFFLASPGAPLVESRHNVILPIQDSPPASVQGGESWVLGCQRENSVEAIFVILTKSDGGKILFQNAQRINCQ